MDFLSKVVFCSCADRREHFNESPRLQRLRCLCMRQWPVSNLFEPDKVFAVVFEKSLISEGHFRSL
ncbi:hypothetical protein X992_5683 [Burkholderia pseudomallei MSHR5492]|nr:hypothetical protein X992_5683 [Burkholderia pseudomallei MSHR5492]